MIVELSKQIIHYQNHVKSTAFKINSFSVSLQFGRFAWI